MASKLDLLKMRLNENQSRHRNANTHTEIDRQASIELVPLAQIEVNPFQPRITFTQQEIESLAESIKLDGLLQPITVRPNGVHGYQLICGERRFRATQSLGETHIKAFVIAKSDLESARAALAENVQRENLSDFEVSEGIKDILNLMQSQNPGQKVTKSALRKAVGLSQAALYRCLAFHDLPREIVDYLHQDTRLFSGTVAEKLNKALKEAQDLQTYDLCLQALPALLQQLAQGEIKQNNLIPLMQRQVDALSTQNNQKNSSKTQPSTNHLQQTLKLGKKNIGKMEVKGNYWQIKLKYESLSSQQLAQLKQAVEQILQS